MPKKYQYPPSKQINITDDFHGTAVLDPYRWLEDSDAADTQTWIADQGQFTQNFLAEMPFRDAFQKRLDNSMELSPGHTACQTGWPLLFQPEQRAAKSERPGTETGFKRQCQGSHRPQFAQRGWHSRPSQSKL